ncbi:prepilin-type N-terminal cleavage/methylation domain-containing protein [Bacillus sp. HNG]|uniref:prepilin-type N-terminal cleavage/methylation domain-containing protein n=1 Tax=Bacillus sp. HNG TaxID=2293325 RepID=UPI000E2EB13E|nr:prepilin-type N-terminal cleavage/methylation domain-containing protein [Bacillus sp. HNG]RFB17688.1 prepilin-type N-terminal cleavage/methylation domain-containing protein [Bacillus sp. HNG]
MLKKYLKNQKGLTLIELLAVIVILGIIAAIAVPTIGNVINKTKLDAVRADALQVFEASSLAITSEGVPSDNQFNYSTGDNAVNDLQEYIDDTQFSSYAVHITNGVPTTIDFVVTLDNKTYTVTGATKAQLQSKNYFDNITPTTGD